MVAFAFKALSFAALASAAALENISKDLKSQLARTAEVHVSGTDSFDRLKTRWAANINPIFDAIVTVTSEEDVQATVSDNV